MHYYQYSRVSKIKLEVIRDLFLFVFAKITRPLMKRSNKLIYNIVTIGGQKYVIWHESSDICSYCCYDSACKLSRNLRIGLTNVGPISFFVPNNLFREIYRSYYEKK